MDFRLKKDIEFLHMMIIRMGASVEEICGRKVLMFPITHWGYAPVDQSKIMPHQNEWVLVVEEDGDSWIWDTHIMEA